MIFLIKKEDGLLIMDKPAGISIDTSLLWELDITPPTISQLESMTAKSLESFPRQMGWKIVNATQGGKKSLASHVLKSWDVYKDRAMSASSFVMPLNMRREKGKLYFFENSMGKFPMVVKSGQILTHTYLANYSASLDMEMINTSTASELKWCLSQTFGMYMGGSLTTLRKELDDAYASYLEEMVSSHVVAVPISPDEDLDDEDGGEQLQEDEEICDDESVLEAEIANVNYLYGFVSKMDFSTYVSSTIDFYSDNLVDVDFYNHSNEKLFAFPASLDMTVGELKHEFCIRVQAKQRESGIDDSDERFMTVDMFTISSQRFKMAAMENLGEVDNNRVYFHIRQSGGGGVKKLMLKKKVIPTLSTDVPLFENVYKIAKEIHDKESMTINEVISSMNTPALSSLKDYIEKGKATSAVKLMSVATYCDEVKKLDDAIQKLTYAKEKICEMVAQSVIDASTKDGGNFRMDAFKTLLSVQLAVKSGSSASDTAM